METEVSTVFTLYRDVVISCVRWIQSTPYLSGIHFNNISCTP